jgi:aspartate-semialdehyde dehydrogenase
VAIDLTSAAPASKDVPVVNAGVNPEAIGDRPRLIASPQPASQMLSNLLAPIDRRLGLRSCAAVVLLPVSDCGEEGIGELYQQTVALLNFQDPPTNVFGRQVAFNLLPSALNAQGEMPGGASALRVGQEVGAILGPSVEVAVEMILAPVFHCHAVAAHVVLRQAADTDRLLECLAGSEDIVLAPPSGPATPVERAGEKAIMVAGVRASGPGSFWFWAVADNLAAGAVLNAVRIAEALVERGIGRTTP